jgi:putative ABC transport system substrate-binding protein
LLSYAADLVDNFRRAATYVDRILRGEKPGDLPVQLPTKFEMVVNRNQSARSCDTPIDTAARGRGDRVKGRELIVALGGVAVSCQKFRNRL